MDEMLATKYTLEVQPRLPTALERLPELAGNLFYSWERQARNLFVRLDRNLWDRCEHNPILFLRRVSQEKLDTASRDSIYLQDYSRVLSAYDAYLKQEHPAVSGKSLDSEDDLLAYFCLEFGLHESLPIYSGGLGILAGDHCKAASDLSVPYVGIGLLYRHGYFEQTIDAHGNQHDNVRRFGTLDLPVSPALKPDGDVAEIVVPMPGREVFVHVWRVSVGRVNLYLLDSDVPANSDEDRRITYQLYAGDSELRLQQEMILGIGGVRALVSLGLKPTVWHSNEGHAALQVIERCCQYVASGLEFHAALELVAASTVFTTHTPVEAGHDVFEHALVESYFEPLAQRLNIPLAKLLELGTSPAGDDRFNMTALGIRGSRYRNGVSQVHGSVVSHMERSMWPDIPPLENPVEYVTNGVHVPTFLANDWASLFDLRFRNAWKSELTNEAFWAVIDEIPDSSFWSVRQSLKSKFQIEAVRRIDKAMRRNGCNRSQINRTTRLLRISDRDVLVIGFARRFATYKRATLIFSDPDRLARLLNDPAQPVVLVFAGKAHPMDKPGHELIRQVHHFSQDPRFQGKVVLLEGYEMSLTRRLLPGVDVWLNTPQYPLEASGTSGQKAGINGVINLSVLDGWWAEGYNGKNGWAITPHRTEFNSDESNREEGAELLDLLENEVIPSYFRHDGRGYSAQWVGMSKESMKSVIPNFSSQRMFKDYLTRFYLPASRKGKQLARDNASPAQALSGWVENVSRKWQGIHMRRTDSVAVNVRSGESAAITVAMNLNGLTADDVAVECVVGKESDEGEFVALSNHLLTSNEVTDNGETIYHMNFQPALSGLVFYKLRAYPNHPFLSHRFEMGLMRWL